MNLLQWKSFLQDKLDDGVERMLFLGEKMTTYTPHGLGTGDFLEERIGFLRLVEDERLSKQVTFASISEVHEKLEELIEETSLTTPLLFTSGETPNYIPLLWKTDDDGDLIILGLTGEVQQFLLPVAAEIDIRMKASDISTQEQFDARVKELMTDLLMRKISAIDE